VYSGDHVYPSHRTGNVLREGLTDVVDGPFQAAFGDDARDCLAAAPDMRRGCFPATA